MSAVHLNYIDGQWCPAENGETFDSIDPATGDSVGTVVRSTPSDVAAACRAAARAFDRWRLMPAPRRAEILFRAGEILIRRKEEFARLMTREMGKVLQESRGDVQEAIDMAFYMAGEGRRSFGQTTPSELPDKFAMSVRAPLGVVAAITPWNFPLAIPAWKIFPALVLGNTVVYKPSSETAVTSSMIVHVLEEAGLPPGVLNLVHGPGASVGTALARQDEVVLVSFTGSTEVGRQLTIDLAPQMKRLSLEMGGKNAIIVLDDADLDLAVDGIVWSAFGTSGQRCTAASRVIVQRRVHDALVQKLVNRTRQLRLGNGLDPDVDVGPVINRAQLEKIDRYVRIGVQEGARILTGGRIATGGGLERGFFYEPTIFDGATPAMRIAQEEIFGPVTAVITVDSLEEAIAVNNTVAYGLSSAIYTRDVNRAFTAMRELTTGLVYVNAGTIGAEIHLPFGGTRATGNGHREAGTAALDVFSEWKTIFVDYSGRLQRAQIDLG
ncbi:MAG TPA: aldehyde dehydrogenase family protein [Chloroflexota bacterium]|nr:aldehyde dehydrogenase family protein [Chloroflexota bacterium]